MVSSPSDPLRPESASAARASPGRFERQETSLELDRRPKDIQPFVRCPRCEADSARSAVHCRNCGAALETEEVRAFNELFWNRRVAQAEAEEANLRLGRAVEAAEEVEQRPDREHSDEAGFRLGRALALLRRLLHRKR